MNTHKPAYSSEANVISTGFPTVDFKRKRTSENSVAAAGDTAVK
jgi:hypothetical protein